MAKALERQTMRDDRIATIKAFIIKAVSDPVDQKGLASLSRLTDQTLHLLAAAVDSASRV